MDPFTPNYGMNTPSVQMPQNYFDQPFYGGPRNNAAFQQSPTSLANNQFTQMPAQRLYCRYITSEDEITPREIPMDGNLAVFPMRDGSEILVKSWSTNGGIITLRFAQVNNQPQETDDKVLNDIIARLNAIEHNLGMDASKKEGLVNE